MGSPSANATGKAPKAWLSTPICATPAGGCVSHETRPWRTTSAPPGLEDASPFMDADLGDVPRDIRVRRGLVRVDAVLEVRWLRLGSVELVRRSRYSWGHVRGIRVGAAAAQQIPTAIELAPN